MIKWKIAQWLELRWWKSYLSAKDKSEYIAWKSSYWSDLLNKMDRKQTIENASEIVDLGCGPFGLHLLQKGSPNSFSVFNADNFTAVDPLLDDYENQLPFFKKSDYPNCTFIKSGIENFTTQNPFDVVFCMNVINHVYDIEKSYDVINNCCRGNGIVVMSIDAHNFAFFKQLFRIVPGDALHPHQYDLDEYISFLSKRKFHVSQRILIRKNFFFDHYVLVAVKQ
jgi:SAM-dependent methyltransferase